MNVDELMPNLSDEMFNEGLSRAVKWVEDCLSDRKHTDFTPTMLVHAMADDNGEIAVTMAVMPDFEMATRHKILETLGAKFALDKIAVGAIYFVTEVWISSSVAPPPSAGVINDAPNGLPSRKYARPEQDPDRREAISVAALSFDGRAAMAQVGVTRSKRNKMIAGATSFYPYGGEMETTNNICTAFYRGYVRAVLEGHHER